MLLFIINLNNIEKKNMKKTFTLLSLGFCFAISSFAQAPKEDTTNLNNNFRNTLYTSKFGQAQIGGYAQIDYNQKIGESDFKNGNLDVHRMIIFLGHKFNEKVSFFSEIEVEHVKEIYVEQAFLEYKINDWMNFRGGLLLVPMSIVNEYHEPPTFNGVERPNLNSKIVPTTWREMGAGFAGSLKDISLNYQLYLMNGSLGYSNSDGAKFRGKDGIRKGRQKGAKSTMSAHPNIAGKLNYYAVRGLNVGLSTFYGKSQSELYNGINKNDAAAIQMADSSVIGIMMTGFDFRYRLKDLRVRGEFIYADLSNTNQYNTFGNTDLGSSMMGYYGELAYNVFGFMDDWNDQLFVFGRYENYNTHNTVDKNIIRNKALNRNDITLGLHYKPSTRASFKVDLQIFSNEKDKYPVHQINFGVGAWF